MLCHDAPHVPISLLATIFFFFNDTATTEIYTLSLHDALPISRTARSAEPRDVPRTPPRSPAREPSPDADRRSEEHTSELQSHVNLVCRLLLEKKKNKKNTNTTSLLRSIARHSYRFSSSPFSIC